MTMHTLKCTVAEVSRGHEADWALCERLVKECFASQDYIEGRRSRFHGEATAGVSGDLEAGPAAPR